MKHALSFDDVLIVPKKSAIAHRADIDLSTTVAGVPLKIPIISANMSSITGATMAALVANKGGLGLLHRMYPSAQGMVNDLYYALSLCDPACPGAVGFSFGIGTDWQQWVTLGFASGANIGCLDVAHAHHTRVLDIVQALVQEYPSKHFIIGNIATAAAANDICKAASNCNFNLQRLALKVGVGGGSLCTTRIMTGCGVPTLQSLLDIPIADSSFHKVTMIADGGIRSSGDIVKSIVAGANAVMLGSLLAGTDQTPGEVIVGRDRGRYKVYRGSASFSDKKARAEKIVNIEGTETMVPYKGSAIDIIDGLLDGVRSGCSYVGASKLSDLINGEFVEITSSGLRESQPHGIM